MVALEAALREGGQLWLGWSGRVTATPGPRPTEAGCNGFSLATIDLSPTELEGYYAQCANRAHWPLFHSRLDLSHFDCESCTAYRHVNEHFADVLQDRLKAGDRIWIHDCHLFPLGAELRRRGVTAPIGFFLHIPFLAPDILAALPWYCELLDELFSYGLIGFQTHNCLQNFCAAIDRLNSRPDSGAFRNRPQSTSA